MTLGEKISNLRKQRGWTQEILAERIGMHSNHVSRWEKSRVRPSGRTLKRLAELFNVPFDELLSQEQPIPDLISQDGELLEKCKQIRELSADDRAALFHIIDVMATHQRVEKLMAGHRLE